jgi:2-phospho-L-lactate guanylyltransferase
MPWTLIPAKGFAQAKQRLSPILGGDERAALARAMLMRTIGVARAAFCDPVIVLSPDAQVGTVAIAAGADRYVEVAAAGLNAELAAAARLVPAGEALLVLHADLPLLTPDALRAFAAGGQAALIACDRHGSGTNALLLRDGPRAFSFGAGSRARHRAQALAHGLSCRVVRRRPLSHDLDRPEDWRMLSSSLSTILPPVRDDGMDAQATAADGVRRGARNGTSGFT